MLKLQSLRNNRNILSSTFYLGIIEFVKLLLPFVALPYIYSTVGIDKYGLILFVQSIVAYFSILIGFGFDISAVRSVAIYRDDKKELGRIVFAVLGVKLILLLISLVLLTIIVFSFDFFRVNAILYYFVFLSCISDLLFPVWFFQGIEKMKIITLVQFSSVLFYVVTIFLFVNTQSDYIYVPLLQSCGLVLSGLLGFFLLIWKEKLPFSVPTRVELVDTFKDSLPFFASRFSVVINTNIAKTLSGLFLGYHETAVFDTAQKISNAAMIPLYVINRAIFPHNANKQDRRFATKALFAVSMITIVVAVADFIFSPLAVRLIGGGDGRLLDSVFISRILCLWVLISGISIYEGSSVLVAFGHVKPFNYSVLLSTVALLLLYGLFYLTNNFTLISFAFALIFSESFIAIYRLYFCFKFKLFSFLKN